MLFSPDVVNLSNQKSVFIHWISNNFFK